MIAKTYGTVSEEIRRQMTGLEFVRGLAGGELPLNTIARTLGYDVAAAEKGRVLITLVPTEEHLNPAGTVHGGLTATLLDSCMGLAIQSTSRKELRANDPRVQDFIDTSDYAANWRNKCRGQSPELRPSDRHGGGQSR